MSTLADPDINVKVIKEAHRFERRDLSLTAPRQEPAFERKPQLWYGACSVCTWAREQLPEKTVRTSAGSHYLATGHHVEVYARILVEEIKTEAQAKRCMGANGVPMSAFENDDIRR